MYIKMRKNGTNSIPSIKKKAVNNDRQVQIQEHE